MKVTDALLAEYGAATQRRRTEIELALWNKASAEERERARFGGVRRAEWVVRKLGLASDRAHEVERRMALFGYGTAADVLWARLEADLTLSAAAALAVEAKKTRRGGETLKAAVERCLAAYDSRPYVRHVEGGKIARLNSPQRLQASTPKQKQKQKSAKSTPRAGGKLTRAEITLPAGTFWQQVRALLGPYLHERLQGLDEATVARERERFEQDLKVLFAETASRVDRARRDHQPLGPALARRRLRDACQVLRLDPPTTATARWLTAAKRRFRTLAKEYHPDRRGDATRPQYDAVLEAWQHIQDFYEHIGEGEHT
jgi:hypothetical protein